MYFAVAMVVVVSVALFVFSSVPLNVLVKSAMWLRCVRHFTLSVDTKRPKDGPPTVTNPAKRGRRVRMVFVRHAESVWNSIFNKFGLGWPSRAVRFVLGEWFLFFFAPTHSLVIDSPLSAVGREQVESLAEMIRINGDRVSLKSGRDTILVCSNLRRAMQTAAGGFATRLANDERIAIESDLQEGSRNPDASSFSIEANAVPPGPVHGFEGERDGAVELALAFDATHNQGDKPTTSSVFNRIDNFALRVMGEAKTGHTGYITESGVAPNTVVAVGHSLYFMKFFQRFLPPTSQHIAKSCKMQNCAVVEFDLVVDANGQILVDESSINELYLGFTVKGKKKTQ